MTDKKELNLQKINALSALGKDWNEQGALPFSEKAITIFTELISALSRQPDISPTGRSSLVLQYELDDGSLLAFEVAEDCAEKVYVPKGDYMKTALEIFTDNIVQQIKNSVLEFYKQK